MYLNHKTIAIFLLTVLFSLIGSKSYSQQDEAEMRAMFVFNICYGTTWENQGNIEKYTIGVFSDEKEFEAYKKLAEKRVINKKPVEVIRYDKYEDIKEHHVICVTKSENAYLGFVYEKFQGKNVLIVTDRTKEPQYSVINFRKFDKGVRKFDINKELADTQKLKFSHQILKLGGNREALQQIYAETNKKLLESEKKIKELEKQLKEKDEIIKELKKKLEDK